MRVVLLFPPIDSSEQLLQPPLGLLSIASQLKRNKHDVFVLNTVFELASRKAFPESFGKVRPVELYDYVAQEILSRQPDVLGIGTQCLTLPGSINISRRVKAQSPNTFVVLGGQGCMGSEKYILSAFPWIDIIVAGEGEWTVTELVDAINTGEPLHKIRGLYLQIDGGLYQTEERDLPEDMDSLPYIDYDSGLDRPASEYSNLNRKLFALTREDGGARLLIETGRGCKYRCAFCSSSPFWGNRVRLKSLPRVMRELREALAYGEIHDMYFIDDLLSCDTDRLKELCQAFIDSDVTFRWLCRARIDELDPSLLSLMKRAGCHALLLGIETASDKMLKSLNKARKQVDVAQTVRLIQKNGMLPILTFIIGNLHETPNDINNTLILIAKCCASGRCGLGINRPIILPATSLWSQCKNSLVFKGPNYFTEGAYLDDGKLLAEDQLIIEAYPHIFSAFYCVPAGQDNSLILERLLSVFPKLVQILPATILYATQGDLAMTVYEMFLAWTETTGMIDDYYTLKTQWTTDRIVTSFVNWLREQETLPAKSALYDVLSYELVRDFLDRSSSILERSMIALFRKVGIMITEVNQDMVILNCRYDVSAIIEDILNGQSGAKYIERSSKIILQRHHTRIESYMLRD